LKWFAVTVEILWVIIRKLIAAHGFDALAWISSTRVKLGIMFLGLAWILMDRDRFVMLAFGIVIALIYSDSVRPFRDKIESLTK
jgi:hypothetical protein